MKDSEQNRFIARARRYAKVGTQLSGTAARFAGARFFGVPLDRAANALELAAALGGLKGPIMKVAQLLATIPDALPPEYANELTKLQSQAPPMGWAFVKRRMSAELGPDWQKKFSEFEHHPAAAASLGQVHRARALGGGEVACKLQYPDMQSAVEADLNQLQLLFAIRKRFDPAIDTSEIAIEIGARLREELDYVREAKHVALYRHMLKDEDSIRVPKVWPDLSTGRLLTLDTIDCIIDGLRVKRVGEKNYEIVRQYVDDLVTLPDEQIFEAVVWIMSHLKVVPEGAAAAPVAALLEGLVKARPGTKIVCVLSGGNVNLEQLRGLRWN